MMQKLRWLFKFVCLGIGHADGKQSGRVRSWQTGAHTRDCRIAPRRGRSNSMFVRESPCGCSARASSGVCSVLGGDGPVWMHTLCFSC
jgi:hypothetical protein